MFGSAFLRRGDPTRGLLLSVLFHVILFTAIISVPPFGAGSRVNPAVPAISPNEVIYYTKADLLPLISPPKAQAAAPRPARAASRPPRKPAPKAVAQPPSSVPVKLAFHPLQKIESQPAAPDNRRQTIIQPEAPPLPLQAEIRVPNLISWNAPALPPAPPVPIQVRKNVAARPKIPPPPKPPEEAAMPAPPEVNLLRVNAAAIPLIPAPAIRAPRLPVAVHLTAAAPKPEAAPVAATVVRTTRELPAAPALNSGIKIESTAVPLPDLVAVSLAPAPPEQKVAMPHGTRSGEFAASPDGAGEESKPAAASDRALEERKESGRKEPGGDLGADSLAEIHVPGLTITGGTATVPRSALRDQDPGKDPETDLRKLLASASRPSLLPQNAPQPGPPFSPQLEEEPRAAEFFGTRRVYTVYMNMPNLSSGEGSWVLRFAELNEGPRLDSGVLATPEAIHKVDPMYVASAAREKIEGTVTLAAVVLKDGSVANVRVVGSLDPRLDVSAVAALTQWRFRPALKNGAPVDLEVLVQIPFRLASEQGF